MAMTPQQANGILKLAMQMAGNPKTRAQFFHTAQQADPSIRLPADVQLQQFKQQHVREREEEKIRTAAEKAQETQAAARKRLEKKYTEEQIAEIEAVAQKYGISDYEAAAKVYGADLKPAKPDSRPRKSSTWDLPEFDKFAKDPSRAAQDAAYDLIDRFNAGERIG
jgi:lipopolysaccharide export LptBFGC system permease protein LptF